MTEEEKILNMRTDQGNLGKNSVYRDLEKEMENH